MVMFIFILISIILCAGFASALGIMPARTFVESETDSGSVTEYEGNFWIVNNDAQKIEVKVYADGPLQDYIKIDTPSVNLTPQEENRLVKYKINIPDLPPGEHENFLVVEQQVSSLENGAIPSRVRLKHKLTVMGPYPDKFVTTNIRYLEEDEDVSLTAEVINKGKQDIGSVKTTFYVNDYEDEKAVVETGEETLKTSERKLLRTKVGKDVLEKGEFEIRAVTLYDDLESEIVTTMKVGRPEVDIIYFDKLFTSDAINKYNMDLLNKWNKQVDNVYVDVSMKKDGKEIDSFRTKSVNIPGLATERVQDYLDAEGVSEGEYTFDMIVNFWNTYKMDKKTFTSRLVSKDEQANIVTAGPAVESPSGASATTLLLVIIIVILLIMVGIGAFFMMKQIKKN